MKIDAKTVSYKDIYHAILRDEKILLDKKVISLLHRQRERLESLLDREIPMYGVNTGFGALKSHAISRDNIHKLQENLILSHAAGVGNPFSPEIVKTVMLLIILYLSKGFSGVRPKVIETILKMVNKNVIPVVPEKGSVGASGDLSPSSHIALVVTGKGEAYYDGTKMNGKNAMQKAGISPITLAEKEGLALINNTATMTANAVFALAESLYLSDIADMSAALSIEALRATHKAFDQRLHALKPYDGQIYVAEYLRRVLLGSTMQDKKRIQDQYSLRCVPQVHGAIREAITFVEKIINTEINSVTDNPVLFSSGRGAVDIVSGGNFHGEAVAIAMDALRLSVCELANISDRRICSLLDANHNFGLPAFLAKNPGVNSGMMVLQYTTAALVSENKILAHPAVVDSIPTCANIEDHVSMGTISARKTREVIDNVKHVLAIELLTSCQAIDFRLQEGYSLAGGTDKIYKKIRKTVPFFDADCEYTPYIKKIVEMIEEEKL